MPIGVEQPHVAHPAPVELEKPAGLRGTARDPLGAEDIDLPDKQVAAGDRGDQAQASVKPLASSGKVSRVAISSRARMPRAWLSRLRTVPTGMPQAEAMCS